MDDGRNEGTRFPQRTNGMNKISDKVSLDEVDGKSAGPSGSAPSSSVPRGSSPRSSRPRSDQSFRRSAPGFQGVVRSGYTDDSRNRSRSNPVLACIVIAVCVALSGGAVYMFDHRSVSHTVSVPTRLDSGPKVVPKPKAAPTYASSRGGLLSDLNTVNGSARNDAERLAEQEIEGNARQERASSIADLDKKIQQDQQTIQHLTKTSGMTGGVYARDISDTKSKLDSARMDLTQVEEKIRIAQAPQRVANPQVAELNKQISATQFQIERLRRSQVVSKEPHTVGTSSQIETAEQRLKAAQKQCDSATYDYNKAFKAKEAALNKDDGSNASEDALSAARRVFDSSQTNVTSAKIAVTQIENYLTFLKQKSSGSGQVQQNSAALKDARNLLNALREQLAKARNQSTPSSPVLTALLAARLQDEKTVQDLTRQLAELKSENNRPTSASQIQARLAAERHDLADKQKQLKSLEAAPLQ